MKTEISCGFLLILNIPIITLQKHFLTSLASKSQWFLKRNIYIFLKLYIYSFCKVSKFDLNVNNSFNTKCWYIFFSFLKNQYLLKTIYYPVSDPRHRFEKDCGRLKFEAQIWKNKALWIRSVHSFVFHKFCWVSIRLGK